MTIQEVLLPLFLEVILTFALLFWLAFENPRMSAVSVGYLDGNTFAEKLEHAIRASEKVIEGRVIEGDD